MGEELAYAIVTSHSLLKSRTGNILSRLISRTGLELVDGAVYSPCRELAERYVESLIARRNGDRPPSGELIAGYLREKFLEIDGATPRRRVLLLVFRGENAVARMKNVVGEVGRQRQSGETIRDTYGEFVTDAAGRMVFFEPAVLIGESAEEVVDHLELWASFAGTDSGVREGATEYEDPSQVQKTLVLIKPDNFRFPNIRPGALIDVFSRTGLYMIGFKVHHMSVAEAEAFYGPVLPVLEDYYRSSHRVTLKALVEKEFGVQLSEDDHHSIAAAVGPIIGRRHWENLINFMAGNRPGEVTALEREAPGDQKTIALVYEGEDAVRKIRDILGPTDPSKAPAGTIRREFGTSVMINAAHASDSVESAEREMALIGVGQNHFETSVAGLLGGRMEEGRGIMKKIRNLFH